MKQTFFILTIFLIISFHSTGYSQFWEYQTSGTTQQLNGVFMTDGQTGWVCGDGGTLLKTVNAGQTWTPVTVTGDNLNSIVFKDANTGIIVGDNGKIFRTTNAGLNWNAISSGTIEQFRKVTHTGSVFFASGDNGLAAVSSDDGATWQLKNSGTLLRFRGAAAADNNKLWAVGENGLIRHSSDGGTSWSNQNSGITNDDLHDIQFINENIGFAGGSGSNFIFTNDGGQNWVSRNSGIFSGLNGIYFQDENIGWAVSIVGTIYFTTDGGNFWTSQPCGSPFTLREAYFLNQGRGWTVGESGTIVMYNNPTIPVELNSFTVAINGNSVVLNWTTATETNNQGFEIQRQQNSQNTKANEWNSLGFVTGFGTTTESKSYSFTDNNLIAGSYLYRLKQVDLDGGFKYFNLGSEVLINTPQEFSLDQNYPNPFNPSTVIKYSLPSAAEVLIKVYDIIGNEVTTLVNENKEAGSHEVEFNSKGLSSGIYIYTIQAGSFVQTRKMTLMK